MTQTQTQLQKYFASRTGAQRFRVSNGERELLEARAPSLVYHAREPRVRRLHLHLAATRYAHHGTAPELGTLHRLFLQPVARPVDVVSHILESWAPLFYQKKRSRIPYPKN